MPPDDPRIEDARAWHARAELDLRTEDLELGAPEAERWGEVAFHAQQAAEKRPTSQPPHASFTCRSIRGGTR